LTLTVPERKCRFEPDKQTYLLMTNEKFTFLPFSVKLNKLLLEAEYIGTSKIKDKLSVLYLLDKTYFEILYTEDMDQILSINEVDTKHLIYFCNFDIAELL